MGENLNRCGAAITDSPITPTESTATAMHERVDGAEATALSKISATTERKTVS